MHIDNRISSPWPADGAPRRFCQWCRWCLPLDVHIVVIDPKVFVKLIRQLARPTPTSGLILLQ